MIRGGYIGKCYYMGVRPYVAVTPYDYIWAKPCAMPLRQLASAAFFCWRTPYSANRVPDIRRPCLGASLLNRTELECEFLLIFLVREIGAIAFVQHKSNGGQADQQACR